jgi:hypothetical protein
MYSRGGTKVIYTSDDTHNAILVCSNAVEEVKLATDGGNSCADNLCERGSPKQTSFFRLIVDYKIAPDEGQACMARRQKNGCIRYQLVATDRRAAIRQGSTRAG